MKNRVLLVEDKPLLLALAEQICLDAGIDVDDIETVNNGADAIGFIAKATDTKDPFTLVLTDLHIGDGPDGLAVAVFAKEKRANVVLLTGTPHSNPGKIAADYGLLAYIHKPYKAEELREIIRRAIGAPVQSPTLV